MKHAENHSRTKSYPHRHPQRQFTYILAGALTVSILVFATLKPHVQRTTAAIAPVKLKSLSKSMKNWGISNLKTAADIRALDAWKIEDGDRNVVVAVVDTGIDPEHIDLKSNLWHGNKTSNSPKPSHRTFARSISKVSSSKPAGIKTKLENNSVESKSNTVNDAANSESNSEDTFGWDFVQKKANPIDVHGHGTHIAGIIGAVANPEAGVSGVAQEVSIMAVRYYSDSNPGVVNLRNTISAIEYAIQNGANIINYSGGGPVFSQDEYLAMKKAEAKGILVVAAAGNDGQNIDLAHNYYYPSAYGLSNIISVTATNMYNQILPTSNWGKTKVDVAAPGENIYSTMPRRFCESKTGCYGYQSGTSQATAFVSGLAALLLAKDPTLTPQEIKEIITTSSDKFDTLTNRVASGGRVNAFSALQLLERRNNLLKSGPEPKKVSLFDHPFFQSIASFAQGL